ncbi:IclR family transcriptional regulator [Cryobacterium glaciale]|uniref:IclR family transcriptional regulator n=1 Tax=Cryobacterium glaciale TaxID=1259145 RepID=A0A4R8UWJ6_9MICO|nr:IclR family transcriptional regulator [Cryobacterium glaciale]TFB72114.1 IclR family transcriptional regulator [Cryobacterium glaciale]
MIEGEAPMTSKDTEGKGPAHPISSVGNALRLLLMVRDQPQQRLSDVAKALGVSTSTAHRLLAMLQSYDFVRQVKDMRTYVAGPVFVDLRLAAVRNMDVRALARPILTELAMKLNETVHLAQLEGMNVRYLIGAEGESQLRVADRTGQVMPAHMSATGRALLADLPVDRRKSILDRLDAEGVDVAALREDLDQIRQQGYALNFRVDDIVSMATALRDRDNNTIAAINAAGPTSRMSQRDQVYVARQLHAAAAQLEDALRSAPLA